MDRDTAREKYERRSEEIRTIERIDADGTVHTDLWSYDGGDIARALVAAGVRTGDRIVFETALGSQVTGARRVGTEAWISRKTTDELIDEHEAMVAGFRRREEEDLAQHRADWTAREAALPGWLRERLAYFHAKGGRDFELGGWGYELTICEITQILLEHDVDDNGPEVMAYARANGTTGNQHGMAMALAKAHLEDPFATMSGTISALSPISGDPDYSGRD